MSFKKRYILAQEAEERIVSLYRKECGASVDIFNTAIDACQSIVLDMYDNSSADVVEIVRCKNCKFNYANQIPSEDVCQLCVELPISKDFYCAYGERKDDETD